MAALRDRAGAATPSWVKMKPTYFDWRRVDIIKNTDNNDNITKWFDTVENKNKYYDAANETKILVDIPKFPMVPM